MRIIKCDICKNEIIPELLEDEFFRGRRIDLCHDCHEQFRSVKNDIIKEEEQLHKEYETKREKLYTTLVEKFKLNKE